LRASSPEGTRVKAVQTLILAGRHEVGKASLPQTARTEIAAAVLTLAAARHPWPPSDGSDHRKRKADWDAVGAVQDGVVTNLEAQAARYGDFAGAASGQSACFEQWATEVSGDQDVLGWLADLPEDKQQPNLVFAAARWHGVPAPGAYQVLRDALIHDNGAIRSTIMKRSTQTNEVVTALVELPQVCSVKFPTWRRCSA